MILCSEALPQFNVTPGPLEGNTITLNYVATYNNILYLLDLIITTRGRFIWKPRQVVLKWRFYFHLAHLLEDIKHIIGRGD